MFYNSMQEPIASIFVHYKKEYGTQHLHSWLKCVIKYMYIYIAGEKVIKQQSHLGNGFQK